MLHVPPAVYLRYVDLSIELQVLGFYRARQEEYERTGPTGDRGPLMRSVGLAQGPGPGLDRAAGDRPPAADWQAVGSGPAQL